MLIFEMDEYNMTTLGCQLVEALNWSRTSMKEARLG
jgi:hypothetical protein